MNSEGAAYEHLDGLPGCRRFAQQVARDCAQGRNILVLTGAQLSTLAIRTLLENALWREEGPQLVPVTLSQEDANTNPPAVLARYTGTDEEHLHPGLSPTGPSNQITDQVFLLEGVDRLPVDAREAWVSHFRLWAKYPRTRAYALILPLPARPDGFTTTAGDTHLAVHHWWGRISLLDLQLLCRLLEDADSDPLVAAWRESVLPHLAGADVRLAAKLWNVVLQSEKDIVKVLEEHGREMGLDPSILKAATVRAGRAPKGFGRPSLVPTSGWEELWGMGAAQYSPEQGVELTAVTLALLERPEDVRHRIWRGQAALLLSRLDQVRITVCHALTQKHGAQWPVKLGKLHFTQEELAQVEKDPLATEFGPLRRIVRQPNANARAYVDLVSHAREMRNALAHYQMVTLNDFRVLCAHQARLGLL